MISFLFITKSISTSKGQKEDGSRKNLQLIEEDETISTLQLHTRLGTKNRTDNRWAAARNSSFSRSSRSCKSQETEHQETPLTLDPTPSVRIRQEKKKTKSRQISETPTSSRWAERRPDGRRRWRPARRCSLPRWLDGFEPNRHWIDFGTSLHDYWAKNSTRSRNSGVEARKTKAFRRLRCLDEEGLTALNPGLDHGV